MIDDAPIFPEALGGQSVTLLAVRPHPDDESSATGGLLV
jgi:LmbE family N-acetylglucosaminyl deacetylase